MKEAKELKKEDWHENILEMSDPPKQLNYRGQKPDWNSIFLTVVGSRKYSQYGKEVCQKLIAGLKGYDITIVSGLALGIDAIAHNSALDNGLKTLIKPHPLGICLCLTAWNFPIALVIRKIAPALAAGCSVIIKPSEETPGTAIEVVKIFQEAGLPKDVINLVFGVPHEISDYLLSRDEVKKLSFTGSVPVGKLLAKKAAETLKRCTLELGGHSPAIIAEDADIEATLDTLTGFKFRNAGQVCIAPSRFYVHEKIYDKVRDGFLKRIKNITLGNGLHEGVTMGPLSNSRRVAAMKDFIDDAVENGSTIIYGGSKYKDKGYFWEPTLIENINEGSKMITEEIFGPILPLFKFKDYDEVIEKANSLNYGLASYVYTNSKALQEKMFKEIIAGGVSINTASPLHPEIPYGGIKESGIGYEGGMDAIYSFIHKKNINII